MFKNWEKVWQKPLGLWKRKTIGRYLGIKSNLKASKFNQQVFGKLFSSFIGVVEAEPYLQWDWEIKIPEKGTGKATHFNCYFSKVYMLKLSKQQMERVRHQRSEIISENIRQKQETYSYQLFSLLSYTFIPYFALKRLDKIFRKCNFKICKVRHIRVKNDFNWAQWCHQRLENSPS